MEATLPASMRFRVVACEYKVIETRPGEWMRVFEIKVEFVS